MKDDELALYKFIGLKLRAARRALDVKQSELAHAVGFTRTSIVNIEAGNQALPLARLYGICSALHIEPASVLPSLAEVGSFPQMTVDTTILDMRILKAETLLKRLRRKRLLLTDSD